MLRSIPICCFASALSRGAGYPVEVFTYERNHGFPSWIIARDAGDILPTETVMVYRSDPEREVLHSTPICFACFCSIASAGGGWAPTPRCCAPSCPRPPSISWWRKTTTTWATTGPTLLTGLIRRYHLEARAASSEQGCPFIYKDVPALFDPDRTEEMTARASASSFMHLCCEMWRRIGIPMDLGAADRIIP